MVFWASFSLLAIFILILFIFTLRSSEEYSGLFACKIHNRKKFDQESITYAHSWCQQSRWLDQQEASSALELPQLLEPLVALVAEEVLLLVVQLALVGEEVGWWGWELRWQQQVQEQQLGEVVVEVEQQLLEQERLVQELLLAWSLLVQVGS